MVLLNLFHVNFYIVVEECRKLQKINNILGNLIFKTSLILFTLLEFNCEF